ncbi:beta-1,4-galactosyltransferase galt-1-like [Physella acuta]|uniref:beta-1,4-galactosyltransferase galt-1-like n=1 Tax=Physella acuta TaxID=109671 RepID=UPI0027DD816B|nr:beta-1,4-galactosyltransferase galt-1-like [Physella acuta]
MRCNLSKLVRWTTVTVVFIVCINVFVFIHSPRAGTYMAPSGPLAIPRYEKGKSSSFNSSITCPGLSLSKADVRVGFQHVPGTPKILVYSAFYLENQVKVIGLVELNVGIRLTCQLWYDDVTGDPLVTVDAKVSYIPEDHSRRLSAAIIFCAVPENLHRMAPHSVSLVRERCDTPENILRVAGPAPARYEFTVCVTPLNFRYSRAYELVEMVEMNKLLGAQRVVFYNHSTGANVDKVLDYYIQRGDIEVLPWHLPLKTETWPPSGDPDVHYFAQLASLNDCLYRYRNQSRYIVYTDIDEFIVPRNRDNWHELVQDFIQKHPAMCSLTAMCTFYRKEWPKIAAGFESPAKQFKSVVLTHTLREKTILPYGSRSKYIVAPHQVGVVGVHQVWSCLGEEVRLSQDDALLHHYRTWEAPLDPQPRVEDETAVKKFGPALAQRLEAVWKELPNIPLDVNISSYGQVS